MKHPVSVAELLELHRLGELYLKWTATPFAISEDDLQELQEISDRYQINHSSALFSFQRQYQRDMAIGIEKQLDQALETIPGLAAALAVLPTTPLDAPGEYTVPEEIRLQREKQLQEIKEREERDAQLERMREKLREENEQVTQRLAEEDPDGPHAALLEQVHEDNKVDRELQAAFRADQLRSFRQELDGEMSDHREIEILREISNVDELTPGESARLDELLEKQQLVQDSGSHKIPAGVVQDAITTGHIEKVK